jgi:hypothetical protein
MIEAAPDELDGISTVVAQTSPGDHEAGLISG